MQESSLARVLAAPRSLVLTIQQALKNFPKFLQSVFEVQEISLQNRLQKRTLISRLLQLC